MKEILEYRAKLIKKLVSSSKAFREACLAVKDPLTPLEKDGWNVHQIASHTRDVDKLVYGKRAKITSEQDNPEFQNFDGDAYMAEHYDPHESLNEMLDEFVESVENLVNMLKELPIKAWSRESRHTTLGSGFTLQSWVERDLAHIEEHLKGVGKAA